MHRDSLSRLARVLLAPLAAVMLFPALAGAALVVKDQTDPTVTPQSLAQKLGGVGVVISNVTYAGTVKSSGEFTGGTGIIGFEEGVILSSGWAADTPGPNSSDSNTQVLGTGGDADLTALSGFPTFDKTVLEFDITPQADTLTFDYVFASEEYNEYVESSFNDVFAFFVESGGVKVNCAVVPGTTPPQPVSINTINNGNPFGVPPMSNPAFYRNNDLSDGGGLINTEADGLTVVLTCNAAVTPGVPNHIKLAIADASDTILDSWVFLRANSFVSTNITLEPLTATNPLGTPHTVTATVTQNGQPVEGELVTFEVIAGPHTGVIGFDVTDANGEATFTYTGSFEGTDTLQAYFDEEGGPQESNTVEKVWVDLGASTLDLQPETATNPVATMHCVTATALNAGGNPAPNVTVYFSVSGSVTASGSNVTNDDGEAEFCYAGPLFPGADAIFAFADNNNNGELDPTEPSDTAEKTWVLPQSTAGCKITYGGHITAQNGDFANFGGNAKAPNKGNMIYKDHGPADPQTFKMQTILSVVCDTNDTHGTIYAETKDGDLARVDVQDLGEPGRKDTYRIQVSSGYDSGEQTLAQGGNIQIHH